jgi:hypothetical protein
MGSMKKVIYVLLGLFFLLIGERAESQVKASLRITQVADAQFETSVFQFVFYGDVQLVKNREAFGTRTGEGYDMKFTFFANSDVQKKDIIKYAYLGADCIAKFQIWDIDLVSECVIVEVKNIEGLITITTRAKTKLDGTIKKKKK